MPRIVTMIASATEIVCALGFEKDLVARSHECDYPPGVKKLPVCTAPRFDIEGTSRQIDERVKSLLGQGASIYHVDAELLMSLHPDVIVTQSHCEVCAVSEKDVEQALSDLAVPKLAGRASDVYMPSLARPANNPGKATPRIVSLSPSNLADVWQSIRNVADALEVSSKGDALVRGLEGRVARIAQKAAPLEAKPTVASLEWLDPLMAAGNWVPELVALAGGRNLFGSTGRHSPWMTWDELLTRDPDVIIALPCGFDLARTRSEMSGLTRRPEWSNLRAVRNRRVFITDGNQYFNRPGPRLVESLEILAEIFHPGQFLFHHEGTGWARLPLAA